MEFGSSLTLRGSTEKYDSQDIALFRVEPVIFGNLTWCFRRKRVQGRSEIKKRVMICQNI